MVECRTPACFNLVDIDPLVASGKTIVEATNHARCHSCLGGKPVTTPADPERPPRDFLSVPELQWCNYVEVGHQAHHYLVQELANARKQIHILTQENANLLRELEDQRKRYAGLDSELQARKYGS